MRDRTGKTIKTPHDDHIKASSCSVAHQFVQSGPGVLRARDAIGIDFGDLPSAPFHVFPQFTKLYLGILASVLVVDRFMVRLALSAFLELRGGHSGVEGDAIRAHCVASSPPIGDRDRSNVSTA